MSTVYIDDSGTDPNQPIAVAAGVIIPAIHLNRFEKEWNEFLDAEGIREEGFHASECNAHDPNQRTPYASWDDARVDAVFAHVLHIMRKYGVKGLCNAINKRVYEKVVPPEMLSGVGDYFMWAVSSLLGLCFDWSQRQKQVKMEYVFDTSDKKTKRDMEEAISYAEQPHMGYGEHFTGHYSFRSRKEVPGLQVADFLAWLCYRVVCHEINGIPMPRRAVGCWAQLRPDFSPDASKTWGVLQWLNEKPLEEWVSKTYGSPIDLAIREYRQKRKETRIPKRTAQKSDPPKRAD